MSLSSLSTLDLRYYRDCITVLELHYRCHFFMVLPGVGDEDFKELANLLSSMGA